MESVTITSGDDGGASEEDNYDLQNEDYSA